MGVDAAAAAINRETFCGYHDARIGINLLVNRLGWTRPDAEAHVRTLARERVNIVETVEAFVAVEDPRGN